ncbi:MAG: sulfatase [Candidatus Eisenbacteria sp.]|nr:sulfatase [Candidatus Eisenbacteria bacterium]
MRRFFVGARCGMLGGMLAGLVLGLVHAAILAGSGLFAMSSTPIVLAAFARYAGIFLLMGAVFGFFIGGVAAMLPARWVPRFIGHPGYGMAMLYLIPWIALVARVHLEVPLSLPRLLVVVGILALALLAVSAWHRRHTFAAAGKSAEVPPRATAAPQRHLRWHGLALGLLAGVVLYAAPLVAPRTTPLADALALEGRRLEPLRARATASFGSTRWNVLLVTIDALRADHLGCYGYERATSPRIDSLAAAGIRFENAMCQRPSTSPSFASLFTGLYPAQHGVYRSRGVLQSRFMTLTEHFAAAGYRTGAVIANGNLHPEFGFHQGYEDYLYGHARAHDGTDMTLAWLAEHGGGEQPWFFWVHYLDPHTPYTPWAPYDEMFGRDAEKPSRRQQKIDLYDGEIRFTDDHFGRLLDGLIAAGLHEQTLIVVTADHGESLGEHNFYYNHGLHAYEPSGRVPLIFTAPGVIPDGHVTPAVAGLVDLLPTLLDVAGIPVPDEIQGRSLLPVVLGLTDLAPRDFVILEAGFSRRRGPGLTRALRRAETKYVQRLTDWARRPANPIDVLWTFKAGAEGALSADEYYDLARDPGETANLIEAHRDAARNDRRMLEAFVARIGEEASESRIADLETLPPETLKSLRDLGYIK